MGKVLVTAGAAKFKEEIESVVGGFLPTSPSPGCAERTNPRAALSVHVVVPALTWPFFGSATCPACYFGAGFFTLST